MTTTQTPPRIAPGCPTHSPYGAVQTGKKLADGIYKVTCANHGGIYLNAGRHAEIPTAFRTEDGWYEEDLAVSIVYWFIPETALHNPRIDREACKRELIQHWPRLSKLVGLV